MATRRGVVRRPNIGTKQTTTTSVSFSTDDFLWLQEQAQMRSMSFALVVGEAVALYRGAMNAELTAVEKEASTERRRAGQKKREAHATTTPPATEESVAL